MSEQEKRERHSTELEPQTREKDSPDANEHNERMRTVGRTFTEVRTGERTVRNLQRRVIE